MLSIGGEGKQNQLSAVLRAIYSELNYLTSSDIYAPGPNETNSTVNKLQQHFTET